MEFKKNLLEDKLPEKNEFVEELIQENLALMNEKAKLLYENSVLKEKLDAVEGLNKVAYLKPLVMEGENCVSVLFGKKYKN
jgi:hypothetical protein